jgi:hypothetical protein
LEKECREMLFLSSINTLLCFGCYSFLFWSQWYTLHCFVLYTYLQRWDYDNGESAQVCVSSCKCPPCKRNTNCQTSDQAPFRPVLYALLHISVLGPLLHTFIRPPPSNVYLLLILQAATCCSLNGVLCEERGGETFIYLPIWECPSYLRSVKLKLIGIACNVANTGLQYVCNADYNRSLQSSGNKSDNNACYI